MGRLRTTYVTLAIVITSISLGMLFLKLDQLPPIIEWWPESSESIDLAIATLFAVFQITIASLIFHSSARGNNENKKRLIAVFLLAQAGKYAPGRIWSPFIQKFVLGEHIGISGIFLANIIVFGCVLFSQILTAMVTLVYFYSGVIFATIAAALGLFVPNAILIFLASTSLTKKWIFIDELSKISRRIELLRNIGLLFLSGILTWAFFYIGWLKYSVDEGIALIGTTSVSVIAGYFSLLPAGLGVREAMFIAMKDFAWPLPYEHMPQLAIQSRTFLFLVDALTAVLGLLLLLFSSKSKS